MKKLTLLIMAVAAVMLASLTACSEMDGCWGGNSLYFLIENEDGENLLDPAVEGNLVDKFTAQADAGGKTYDLDWSVTKIATFPDIEFMNNVDKDGNYVHVEHPDGIPEASCGFRYLCTKADELGEYPSRFFLYFGDYSAEGKWKRKVYLRFPSLGKNYDITWENNDGDTKVKVNGERLPDYGNRFGSYISQRVIIIKV